MFLRRRRRGSLRRGRLGIRRRWFWRRRGGSSLLGRDLLGLCGGRELVIW